MFNVERRHPKGILPNEGTLLYSLIRLARPLVAVEIGRLGGASTEWIARALADNCSGVVHSIDVAPVMPEAKERLAPWVGNHVVLHTFSSHGEEAKKLADELGAIDFLWVDGNHSAAGVEADCKLWMPRLRGYAVFHDWGRDGVVTGYEATTKGQNLRSIEFGMQGRRENTAGLLVVQQGRGAFRQ